MRVGNKLFVVEVSGGHHFKLGSDIEVIMGISKMHVFDKSTTKAIIQLIFYSSLGEGDLNVLSLV